MTISEYKKHLSSNRKVKNAVKSVVDGVSFDSRLEKTMYDLLAGAGIKFEFQKVFVLQDSFRYRGEAIRAIKCIVDFYLPDRDLIIDTKGYANDVSPIKYKMLKRFLVDRGLSYNIIMPKNKRECKLTLNKLLFKHEEL